MATNDSPRRQAVSEGCTQVVVLVQLDFFSAQETHLLEEKEKLTLQPRQK